MGSGGLTAGRIQVENALFIALLVMATIAFYNVVELLFLITATFKRYKGLYFWSMIISSLGVFLHGMGFLMKFFELTTLTYLSVTIVTIGWYAMVTGQSVVLWSRLHLVEMDAKLRRRIIRLIIIDAIIFHIPTTVFTYGSNAKPSVASHFVLGYKVMEKIQMTAFCLQEFLLSLIYIRATWRRLPDFHNDAKKRTLIHLLVVNVIIILLDLALLGVEYANLYTIEVMLKSAVYSIKLKLEFSILNQLVNLVHPSTREQSSSNNCYVRSMSHVSAFTAPARFTSVEDVQSQKQRSKSAPDIVKTTHYELSWIDDSTPGQNTPKGPNDIISVVETSARSSGSDLSCHAL